MIRRGQPVKVSSPKICMTVRSEQNASVSVSFLFVPAWCRPNFSSSPSILQHHMPNDTSNRLTYRQRKTIEQLQNCTAPVGEKSGNKLSNLIPSMQVKWNKYKAVRRFLSSVRAELTSMELCILRVDSSHGSLHELCTSLSFADEIRNHHNDASQYHLNLFGPVCLHHEIRAEHNIVIMEFPTQWMLLSHARAFNSAVPDNFLSN